MINRFLWQGTNGGLQRLDVPYYYKTDSLRITHYPLADDGIGMEFNLQSLAVTEKNHVWVSFQKTPSPQQIPVDEE